MDFKSILQDIGYSNIKDNGRELRMRPIYRESGNNSVLSVKKETGHFVDFSKSISGSFEYLIQLSLGLKNINEAKEVLEKKWFVTEIKRENRPAVKGEKIFPKKYLSKLIPFHEYWINRGISLDTIQIFEGGFVESGTMANRYVFPIFDSKRNLIGVTGRYIKSLENKNIPKWLHKGRTSEWKYPIQINYEIIKKEKKVILIESIGDMLSLWEAGIRNTMVVFGLNLHSQTIGFLIKLNLDRIYIAFNNDSYKNSAGNEAATKAKRQLSNHFDEDQIKICLPDKKDFGEMSKEEITNWEKGIAIE